MERCVKRDAVTVQEGSVRRFRRKRPPGLVPLLRVDRNLHRVHAFCKSFCDQKHVVKEAHAKGAKDAKVLNMDEILTVDDACRDLP